jgi:membrane-associated phospholipid phosphatase
MKVRRSNWFISGVALIGKVRLITCLVLLLPLILLSKAILEKRQFAFEPAFLEWLHTINEPLLIHFLQPFYTIGDTQFAAIIVVISLGVLAWRRYWQEATVLAIASLGVLLLVDKVLKPFFLRRRPPMRLDDTAAGFSFPSGHATGNFVLYLFLAYILAHRFPKYSVYIYGIAIVFLLLMGLSSMYLRVHWPTDIIGGYGYGFIWLTVCLTLLKLSSNKYK